jgi:hypothetical protein
MNKAEEPWYWNNLNAITALILLVAMIALCSLLAPDRPKKATVYQNDNLTIQCIEKKVGACERVKIKSEGVNNEANNR